DSEHAAPRRPGRSRSFRLCASPEPRRGNRLERFRAKACPGLDPGWVPVRVKKTRQNKKLARISHGFKRIGAPNQRKLFCENDFLVIRGEPRCRQSVPRICLDLKPSKGAR